MGLFFTNGYLAVGTSYELVRALYESTADLGITFLYY